MSEEYIEKAAFLAQVRKSKVSNPHLDSRDRHAHDAEHRHFEYMVFIAKPADVTPVVRCKYCKHYKDGWCYNPNTYDDEKTRGNTSPDWYCADGKRRETK